MKYPGRQQENPAGQKFCGECGTPLTRSSGSNAPDTSYADLGAALSEALERENATSEILRVISQSPTDVKPVFAAVLASAARLCDAVDATMFRVEGEELHLVAHEGPIPAHAPGQFPLVRGTPPGRVVLDRRTVHVADLQAEPDEFPVGCAYARRLGFRTILGVPLLRGDEAIGVITIRRTEKRPFTDRQVALLQTFANQAVIAIENVRLFNETKESLEQQTATAEILRVISTSPTDVQPVFDAIVESAVRLSGALFGSVYRFDGELIQMAAHHNYPAAALEFSQRSFPTSPTRQSFTGRAILERAVVHVPDVSQDRERLLARDLADVVGFRSALSVPMLCEGSPIGAITVWRSAVGRFSDKQIELLQAFADQAVIAIENVRLFNETKEALERQTATSEILRVISSSPMETQPVFDIIAANAARLCAARDAQVLRIEGDVLRLVSAYGSPSMPSVRAISRGHAVGRAVIDRQTIHIRDMAQAVAEFPETSSPRHGVESLLAVPLLREDVAVGVIRVSRTQIQPFTEQQIKLLQTFADQAVIAIENVRLFTELQEKNRALTQAHAQVTESLAQQTATAEILRVISSSPTDTQPVFDTIVQSAARLCHAANAGVFLTDGRTLDLPANYGSASPEALATIRAQYPRPVGQETTAGVAILTRSVIHVPDIEAPSAAEVYTRRVGRLLGVRSMVAVPMMRKGEVVGVINLSRQEPGRFSEMEVELLQAFADQAVIAIENVRLFKELQARTADLTRSVEQLTALGDVGRTLSSTLDLDTVLQTIVTRASQLAGTDACSVFEYDETTEAFHLRATQNLDAEVVALARSTPIRKGEGVQGRMAVTRQAVQIPDIAEEDAYHGPLRDILLSTGTRAVLAIPMLREDQLIGGLTVNKKTSGAFAPEVIELRASVADNMAEISVTDTGVGIAPEDQATVFEEFRQVGTAAKKVEGTGLGLALSRKFIELHGGRIWVKSQVGQGSAFTFTLPVRRGECAEMREPG